MAMEEEPIRILLIEENAGDGCLPQEALVEAKAARFHLERADRLATGLERLARGGIDVVLLDLSLPESQGLDTFLRARAQAPDMPIVVLACPKDEPLAVEAVQGGAQDYLVKGRIDGGALVRSLRYAMERHRAAKLQQAHQRQIDFVSVASHELRTPMTTILGFANLLLERDPPEASRREWLERIHRDCRRLAHIVDEMLNVSRIQSGNLALNLETLPLPEIVEEVLADIRPTTQKHDLLAEIAPDTPQVFADRDKLAQVLLHLVDNAVKYSPKGGRITVATRHEPKRRRVTIAVADQGLGIAPEDREPLFTAFHRIRRPESDGIRGTGLGLYIVKGLVEVMNGKVWVKSALDKGSTFFFTVPTNFHHPVVVTEAALPWDRRAA